MTPSHVLTITRLSQHSYAIKQALTEIADVNRTICSKLSSFAMFFAEMPFTVIS